jgi:toluene monooxygenase system ferredoxin subunit
MAFKQVCSVNSLWEGEMAVFDAGTQQVLVVNAEGGVLRAFDPLCPHQRFPLIEGTLDGLVITCKAHLWKFDVSNGEGINPTGCRLRHYPLKVEGEHILVDVPDDG